MQEARAEFESGREAEPVVLDQSDEEGQEAAPPKPTVLVIAEEVGKLCIAALPCWHRQCFCVSAILLRSLQVTAVPLAE